MTVNEKAKKEAIAKVLVDHAKHKKDRVFMNELSRFLDSGENEYYFLSEDYYESYLRYDSLGRLEYIVISEKDPVVERSTLANAELRALHAN